MEIKKPLVSVIVPVYNGQKYLRRCLDSLVGQSYSNLQIIVIDDGSTDDTGAICAEYISGIQYIRQDNAGVSVARNRGLETAEGEYLAFCDSDDYCAPEMIMRLVEALEITGADIGCCKLILTDETQMVAPAPEEENEKIFQVVSINQAYEFVLDEGSYSGYIWNKMFRRSLIEKTVPIRFAKDIAVLEDELFVVEYLRRCRNMCPLSSALYYYYQHEGSVTAQKISEKKLTAIDGRERILKHIEHAELDVSIRAIAWNKLMRTYAYMFKDLWKYSYPNKNLWLQVIYFGYQKNKKRYRKDNLWTWKARIYELLIALCSHNIKGE